MSTRLPPPLLWTGLWLLVMGVALAARPLLPVDETRYLAVAWEMWLRSDYLVPYLNGETYSHKPPLLFWLINLGWGVFGVNDWWPRLVAPMCGLASLFLTARLARDLWPDAKALENAAPLLLFGGLFWALFTTLTMFDMMLTLFTLIALVGVLRAWKRGGARDHIFGFILFGLGIGFGVLTKGPAILLHTLPVALLAPWWGRGLAGAVWDGRKGAWYAGVAGGVVLGVAIALAWAIPAGEAGGQAYREAIFWGQSAGRIVSSFAHKQSWWWYGATLPVLLLPWIIWPPAWRALRRAGAAFKDSGVRFCVAWFVPALLVFSVISGKQFHYLLPDLPAAALVLAWVLFQGAEEKASRIDPVLPGLLAVLVGGAIFFLPYLPLPTKTPPWLDLVATGWGGLLVAAGVAVLFSGGFSRFGRIAVISTLSAVFVVTVHLALRPALAAVYDLKPVAERLARWQGDGVALANFSKYHGQYQFLGRLKTPITQVGMLAPDMKNFIKANPNGLIIAYHDKLPSAASPIAVYRFRSRLITIWEAKTVKDNPGITERSSGLKTP